MIVAHGGTPGLIVEITPLVLLAVGAVVVWRHSREEGSDGAGGGDEASVEEERGDGE